MPGIVAPPGYPDELKKYATMMKVGIPESAVRGKLAADGWEDDTYDKYLNPDTAITTQTQEEDDDGDNNNENESNDSLFASSDGGMSDDDLKKEEFDPLDPSQAQAADDIQKTPQSQAPVSTAKPSGFFSGQSFVPPPDSDLKMDTLQAVPVKKTLLIVNTFIVNTSAFLNKFVATCESKLHKIHSDVARMETTLLLLESKLGSIDWLRQAEQGQAPNIPNAPDFNANFNNNNEKKSNEQKTDAGNDDDGNEEAEKEPEQPKEDSLLSDPEMIPWFKMLKVGVPQQAVRNKMSGSGVDDDKIDRVINIHKNR